MFIISPITVLPLARNAPMACQGKNVKGIDLKKWKTANPNFIIPDKMLQESIERAKRDIINTRDSEWNLWEARECSVCVCVCVCVCKGERERERIFATG